MIANKNLIHVTLDTGSWKTLAEQRTFLDDIAKKYNITDHQEWYNISRDKIRQNGGHELLKLHKYSLGKLVTSIYPEYEWDIDKFRNTTNRSHPISKNIAASVVKSRLSREPIVRSSTSTQKKKYHHWGYWKDIDNQRQFLSNLAKN